MAKIRRYCSNYILETTGDKIREYCGPFLYQIEGFISHKELMALIAILFA